MFVCVYVCVKLVVLETGSNSAQVRQATQRCDMRNLVVGVSRSDIANSEDFALRLGQAGPGLLSGQDLSGIRVSGVARMPLAGLRARLIVRHEISKAQILHGNIYCYHVNNKIKKKIQRNKAFWVFTICDNNGVFAGQQMRSPTRACGHQHY